MYKAIIFLPFVILGCTSNVIQESKVIQKIDNLDMNIFSQKGEKIYSITSPNSNYDKIKLSSCKFDLKKRFNILFKISNTNNMNDFQNYIISLKRKANLEEDFEKLGINIKTDLKKIVKNVNMQRLSNNPIYLTKNELKKIIQS